MTENRLVFLTGATGFIGGRLAAALAARGYRLRCLVRDPSRAGALRELGAELVAGDVTAQPVLEQALADADVAFHLAAIYDVGIVDAAALERVNVGGTRAFLDAVKASGISRAVHVSTTAALGPVASGVGDERSRYDGPYPTVYHRTKTRAHELALSAQAAGLPLVVACPAYVYGPGDAGTAGSGLVDLLRGRLPALPRDPAWYSFVHVDDVVDGLIAMAARGRIGETYVLGGEHASLNDFLEQAARAGGARAPRLRIPNALAIASGALLDAVSRATGIRFAITRERMASATAGRWLHSHEKSVRELGYAPRSLAEGLPETMAWTRAQMERTR